MKKFKLNYLFIIIGFGMVFGGNYYINIDNSSTQIQSNSQNTIVTVSTGSITQSIETNGSASLANEQSLSFNQTGQVEAVYFSEGDEVKSGQVIAKLDDTDGQNSIKQAQISLQNAQLSLDALYDDPDESTIMQQQNSISSAKKSLEVAQKELENLYETKEIGLDDITTNIENLEKELENLKIDLSQAQKDLEITKKSNTNSLANSIENKNNSILQIQNNYSKDLIELTQIIDKIDILMGVSDENEEQNDDFEDYLGAKNKSQRDTTRDLLKSLLSKFEDFSDEVNNFDITNKNIDENISLIEEFIDINNDLAEVSQSAYQTVINSIVASTLTQSEIESYKSSMLSYKNTAVGNISTLNTRINTLKTLTDIELLEEDYQSSIDQKEQSIDSIELSITKQEQEIESAKKNYETQEKSYDLQIESKLNSIESSKKALEVSQQSYAELLEGPTDAEVTKATNSVKQAQISLQSAYDNLDQYEIEAPFDGVIRKIDYKVGDNILSDSDKSIYIEDPDMMELTVYLDQVDIINVSKGDRVNIIFDGYSDIVVNGKISVIDTTPISSSGVVTYAVTIILDDEDFDKTVLSGMTADIEIITNELNDILLLDSSAISSENGKYYVTKMEGGKEVKTTVEIGEISDGKTQIISGLNVGDKVIVKTIVSSGTSTGNQEEQSTSLLNMGGNTRNRGNGGGPQGGGPGF